MKRSILVLIAVLLVASVGVFADNTDTITVNYEVQAINELEIDAASVTLTISTATAGSEPDDVSDATTADYALTTNGGTDAKKITAAIDTAMPANTHLYLTLVPPTGASSPGEQEITTGAVDVVTGIDNVAESALDMTFRFSATVAAGIVAAASKTLTLILTDT